MREDRITMCAAEPPGPPEPAEPAEPLPPPLPAPGTGPELARGALLVASPTLRDPNFARTVVYVIEHSADGTTGVVLNRQGVVDLDDVLPAWSAYATGSRQLFSGGPVEATAALCLAQARDGANPAGWRAVTDGIGIVDLDADPVVLAPDITGLRVFAGYAGWEAEQLALELMAGAWFVVPGRPGDVFAAPNADLWQIVLARQGPPLAMLTTYPTDLRRN